MKQLPAQNSTKLWLIKGCYAPSQYEAMLIIIIVLSEEEVEEQKAKVAVASKCSTMYY